MIQVTRSGQSGAFFINIDQITTVGKHFSNGIDNVIGLVGNSDDFVTVTETPDKIIEKIKTARWERTRPYPSIPLNKRGLM